MIRASLPTVGLLCLIAAAPSRADEYRDLFNGKDLDGWVVDGPKVDKKEGKPIWTVEDGMIVGSGKALGFLRYDREQFGDFAIRVEYRLSPKSNSGLGIRTGVYDASKSDATRPSWSAYEIQIQDDAGKKPSSHINGSLYRYVAPSSNPVKPAGEWNTMEVECVGTGIKVTVNGEKVIDVDQTKIEDTKDPERPAAAIAPKDKPLKGYVCLQSHSNKIEFRKVQIRAIKAAATKN